MSSMPECKRCGAYVHWGPVLCEDCAEKLKDELVLSEYWRERYRDAYLKLKMCDEVHTLKLSEEYFSLVKAGIKNFEIRLNDRDYRIGDVLMLEEVDLDGNKTGRMIERRIEYLAKIDAVSNKFYSREDIAKHGLVVLGLEDGGMG